MPTPPSRFAGGDQRYLRDEQYRDASRLAARAALHQRYRPADIEPWHEFVARHLTLAPGDHVVEVGCGAGWLWEQMPEPVPDGVRLTLTDLSAGMVAEAVDRARATGRFAAVAGAVLDAQAAALPPARADWVVANHMLHHVPDPARAVAEVARVLRPGGAAVVATSGRRHMDALGRIRAAVFGSPAVHETVHVFGAEVGFAGLREHFDDVAWHGLPHVLRCTEPADVLAYLCSMPPAEDAGPDMRRRLAAAVDHEFAVGGGVLEVTVDSGAFVCRRPRSVGPRR